MPAPEAQREPDQEAERRGTGRRRRGSRGARWPPSASTSLTSSSGLPSPTAPRLDLLGGQRQVDRRRAAPRRACRAGRRGGRSASAARPSGATAARRGPRRQRVELASCVEDLRDPALRLLDLRLEAVGLRLQVLDPVALADDRAELRELRECALHAGGGDAQRDLGRADALRPARRTERGDAAAVLQPRSAARASSRSTAPRRPPPAVAARPRSAAAGPARARRCRRRPAGRRRLARGARACIERSASVVDASRCPYESSVVDASGLPRPPR